MDRTALEEARRFYDYIPQVVKDDKFWGRTLGFLLTAVEELSTAMSPITEPATKDNPSDVVPASTAAPTSQSSPLDRLDTKSGLAALCSTSVNGHQWVVPWAKDNGVIHEPRGWCQRCGALLLSGRIVVPDARQVWSILVKQDSPLSAASSNVASAPSASSESIDDRVVGWCSTHKIQYTPAEYAVHQLRYPSHAHDWYWHGETSAVPEYSHIPEQRVRPEGESHD